MHFYITEIFATLDNISTFHNDDNNQKIYQNISTIITSVTHNAFKHPIILISLDRKHIV